MAQSVRALPAPVLPTARATWPVTTPAKSRPSTALMTKVELPPVEVMVGVVSAG